MTALSDYDDDEKDQFLKSQWESNHDPVPANKEGDEVGLFPIDPAETETYLDQRLEEYQEMLNVLNEEYPDNEYQALVDFCDDHIHPRIIV